MCSVPKQTYAPPTAPGQAVVSGVLTGLLYFALSHDAIHLEGVHFGAHTTTAVALPVALKAAPPAYQCSKLLPHTELSGARRRRGLWGPRGVSHTAGTRTLHTRHRARRRAR